MDEILQLAHADDGVAGNLVVALSSRRILLPSAEELAWQSFGRT